MATKKRAASKQADAGESQASEGGEGRAAGKALVIHRAIRLSSGRVLLPGTKSPALTEEEQAELSESESYFTERGVMERPAGRAVATAEKRRLTIATVPDMDPDEQTGDARDRFAADADEAEFGDEPMPDLTDLPALLEQAESEVQVRQMMLRDQRGPAKQHYQRRLEAIRESREGK